jgi:LysW-gamma-L-lysine carboxypeptidase
MSDYPVRLLTRMLEIYSPSGREEEISSFLAKEMKNLGFYVHKDKVGNVIGEIGQGKPVILLCGHMDTVSGYIPLRVENNKIYGRGSVDAKASLAAMIVASSILAKEGLSGRIIVTGVVDEEGSSKGIKQLIKDGISADYAIFGEPSGVEKITIGYKGSLRLKITCKTQTGHSAASWLFENAIEKAFEIWRAIQKLHLPQEKLESRFYSITSCLIKVKGGKETSLVPSECDICLDLRVPPQFTSQQVFDEVAKVIKQYQTANPKVSVKVKIEDLTDPFEVNQNSLLVKAMSWSIRKVMHKPATLLRKTGTGDMNVLGKAMKIPIVTYGSGDSSLEHTQNENIDIQEYLDSIQVYREAIMKLLELHEN